MAATSLTKPVLPCNIAAESEARIALLLRLLRDQLGDDPDVLGTFRQLNMAVRAHLKWVRS